jgi:hypothetical protein
VIQRQTWVWALLTAAAVMGCAGCEHGITVRGRVNIPLEVQRQFSKDAPGIVVMVGGSSGADVHAELLAVLCDPGSDVLAVPFEQSHYGCVVEGPLNFWVTRLAPVDRNSVACGTNEQSFDYLINTGKITIPDSFDKDKAVASAKVTIFKGQSRGVCRSGEDMVEATVTLTP